MRLDYPVALLCRVFEVSRSGFYAWLTHKPSRRQQGDERLKVAIKAVHRQSRETYGVRRMQPELKAQGFVAGRDRIARLRRELGMPAKTKAPLLRRDPKNCAGRANLAPIAPKGKNFHSGMLFGYRMCIHPRSSAATMASRSIIVPSVLNV